MVMVVALGGVAVVVVDKLVFGVEVALWGGYN
jgi:hypothetical protein